MHPLFEVDLDPKEREMSLSPPPNLKRCIGRLRKNRRRKDGDDQPGMVRKRVSTLRYNNYKQYDHDSRTYQRDNA